MIFAYNRMHRYICDLSILLPVNWIVIGQAQKHKFASPALIESAEHGQRIGMETARAGAVAAQRACEGIKTFIMPTAVAKGAGWAEGAAGAESAGQAESAKEPYL